MKIKDYKLENILFIDIETVPQYGSYSNLPNDYQQLWDKKAEILNKNEEENEKFYQRAGIYAEFGKIICISVGNINYKNGELSLRIKSFYGDDEKIILKEFKVMLETFSQNKEVFLAAHNGKEFDFPYIARRMLINGIVLPQSLQVAGKKPWEVNFIDTLELWKFGDYKNYTSLNLLTHIFGIPTPKDDIDGSMVYDIYYKEKDIERIVKYCEKDVIAVIQVFLKFRGENIISDDKIISVTFS